MPTPMRGIKIGCPALGVGQCVRAFLVLRLSKCTRF